MIQQLRAPAALHPTALQRAQIALPAPIWHLTTICNSNSKESIAFFCSSWALHDALTYMQEKYHKHKNNVKMNCSKIFLKVNGQRNKTQRKKNFHCLRALAVHLILVATVT